MRHLDYSAGMYVLKLRLPCGDAIRMADEHQEAPFLLPAPGILQYTRN